MSKAKTIICKECGKSFHKHDSKIGAIYIESEDGLNIDYFICRKCLDTDKHFHKLNMRHGWSHLYGDISSNDLSWMDYVVGKTVDTVCGKAGYVYLNESIKANSLK